MNVEIADFDARTAARAELEGYFEVFTAASKLDRPDALLPGFEAVVEQVRNPHPALGEQRNRLVRAEGGIVGVSQLSLLPEPNPEAAVVKLMTHPEWRRRGIGTLMLQDLLPRLAAAGREVVAGHGLTAGGAGERWALHAGFRETQRMTMLALEFGARPAGSTERYAVAGYRTRSWRGRVPDELLASYAKARNVIHDAPIGGATLGLSEWTAASVRAEEDELAAAGVDAHFAAAIEEASGEVRALTMIHLLPGQSGVGRQLDTAVHPAHRRRGLAQWVKAVVLGDVRTVQPRLRVLTNVDASNAAMLTVNERLGFKPVRSMLSVEADLEELRSTERC